MSRLKIRHETVYTFDEPTAFGPWRLMMRPSDTHATRVVEASLELSPPGETQWAFDAYGNSICRYQPQGKAKELRVVNNLVVDRFPATLALKDPRSVVPIVYGMTDYMVLQPYMQPEFRDQESALKAWIEQHSPLIGESALSYLSRLTNDIAREFEYAARDEEGTRAPDETVRLRAGACRDLALLMIETLRRFGFAARFASGYLYSPGGHNRGAGATHAWCDVFLPELGWLEFDPTNGIMESRDLIRVAATRTPEEAAPVSGTTLSKQHGELSVKVEVALAARQEP